MTDDEFNSNPAQLHFPTGMETNQSNGATCVDDNTAVLPQKVHSNVENKFPSTPPNGNLKAPSNPQVSFHVLFYCNNWHQSSHLEFRRFFLEICKVLR